MKKTEKKRNKILTVLGIIVFALGGGFLIVNAYIDSILNMLSKTEAFKKEDVSINEEVVKTYKDIKVVNIALYGLDNDELDPESYEMKRSDAIKVLTLDFTNKKIKITSFQRDILIWLPEPENDWSKLNHAYWFGGPQLALSTLNYNFDLDITRYISFSFGSVEKIVDILGGVDIYLTDQEINQISNLSAKNGEGIYHLNGFQVVQYSRIRVIDDDYHRIQRQNNIIEAIVQVLKDKSPTEIVEIISEVLPYVETNISNADIKKYVTLGIIFDFNNMEQYQIPKGGRNDTNSKFYDGYGPNYLLRSYSQNVKDIHYGIYGDEDYIPSDTVLELEKKTYEKFGEFRE